MTGEEYSDDNLYKPLVECLRRTDANLYKSVNAQWAGLKGYANSGGNAGIDPWYTCDSDTQPHQVSGIVAIQLLPITLVRISR